MRITPVYRESGDTRLAKLAAKQHGVVAIWQLLALGYSHNAIQTRVSNGWLHRLHRGVYAVGHTRITIKARWMAAVLACGPDAVLSHAAAAALWELQRAPSGKLDVTAPGMHKIAGIRYHRARNTHPDDRTIIDGIPVTSLSRTLLDLAESLHPQRLRSTIEAAQRREILDFRRLDQLLDRSRGHHGVKPLRAALKQLNEQVPWTRSRLEQAFLELIREAGLPEPQTNVIVDGVEVDCFWPEHNLVVELDGYGFHRSRRSFEEDRRKDARHTVAGRRSLRVTGERMRAALSDLTKLLSGAPAPAPEGP